MLLVVSLAACGDDVSERTRTTETTLAAVCALDASTGVDGVAAVFHDRAHQGLHDIAGWLVDTDPAAAQTLLIAKQAIEEDLLDDPSPDALAAHIAALQQATIAAIAALGEPSGPCPA